MLVVEVIYSGKKIPLADCLNGYMKDYDEAEYSMCENVQQENVVPK